VNLSGGCAGVIQRTYTATDDCDNVTVHTQFINLIDDEAPILSGVPADVTIECDDTLPALPVVTATDNCDPSVPVIVTSETTALCSAATYSTTWTFTATDSCSNVTTDTYTLLQMLMQL